MSAFEWVALVLYIEAAVALYLVAMSTGDTARGLAVVMAALWPIFVALFMLSELLELLPPEFFP